MDRRWLLGSAALLLSSLLACGGGGGPEPAAVGTGEATTSSVYVPMQDGTRLAVDVHLPVEHSGERLPALMVLTRYRRATVDSSGTPLPALGALDRHFLAHGYAVVKVDVRGSGASFGTRPVEYGPQEVRDGYDLVEWVVGQPWSDGNVGAFGTSYTGTTAELLTAVNHPAVKAVIPGWSDFDSYPSPMRPYGLIASNLMKTWSDLVGAMDDNDIGVLGSGVKPVDGDSGEIWLQQALAEHRANPDVYESMSAAEFRDDSISTEATWETIGPIHYKQEIERSKVPMLVFASWLDAGTVDGALFRFQHFSNPQKVWILAGMHGGVGHSSPYTVSSEPTPPQPSVEEQFELRRKFFDRHLKGERNEVDTWPAMRFFNLGEEAFHDTDVWPPAGTRAERFHLSDGGELTVDSARVKAGTSSYTVDPGVTTGTTNRWMAQVGSPIVGLDNRGETDARMLAFTTEPLEGDLQIAGTPVVTLRMSVDRADGAVLGYLEDVGPDGRSRYVTEGGLRLIHRKLVPNPYAVTEVPYHSYGKDDAAPMVPGQVVEVTFQLWPIAALVRAGHRIRLAIAGADDTNFDLVPADGRLTMQVRTDPAAGSVLTLPVVPGGLR